MKLIQLTIVSLLILASPLHAEDGQLSLFQQGVSFLKEQKLKEAYLRFESVSVDSPDFLSSLVELQKLHYKQEQWDQFFAYAVFYRHQLMVSPAVLGSPENRVRFFSSTLIALEVLALVKHCQWQAAEQVGSWGLRLAHEMQVSSVGEIQQAINYLPSLKKLKTVHGHANLTLIPSSIQSQTRYWPIHPQSISYVSHPRFLRMKIESRCSK